MPTGPTSLLQAWPCPVHSILTSLDRVQPFRVVAPLSLSDLSTLQDISSPDTSNYTEGH